MLIEDAGGKRFHSRAGTFQPSEAFDLKPTRVFTAETQRAQRKAAHSVLLNLRFFARCEDSGLRS